MKHLFAFIIGKIFLWLFEMIFFCLSSITFVSIKLSWTLLHCLQTLNSTFFSKIFIFLYNSSFSQHKLSLHWIESGNLVRLFVSYFFEQSFDGLDKEYIIIFVNIFLYLCLCICNWIHSLLLNHPYFTMSKIFLKLVIFL